ncbi:MAG: flagellar basal body-associated FliL family protein [Defluviitaleaceae bacterium]|nr:flagellar basal body-associated FliL family protein [Defluviitaleaceae bacterium]
MAENKNKLMMIIIIVLLAVLLVTIAAVSVIAFRVMSSEPEEPGADIIAVVPVLTPEQIEIIELSSPIGTNLARGATGETHFIRLSLATGVNNTQGRESEEFAVLIAEKEPIVRDVMLGVIKSKTHEELSRPDGRDVLRDEILARLQHTFQNHLLVAVYISDWALQ